MDVEERLVSDYHGTGMTMGPHPMHYRREECASRNQICCWVKSNGERQEGDGCGSGDTRQRPGTAKAPQRCLNGNAVSTSWTGH